jgi:tetratricopeptide (TPR) repeat protein
MDSFLRRSQQSPLDSYYQNTGSLTPFYSPTGTVSRLRQGSTSPLKAQSTRLNASADNSNYIAGNYKSPLPQAGNQRIQSSLGISAHSRQKLTSEVLKDKYNLDQLAQTGIGKQDKQKGFENEQFKEKISKLRKNMDTLKVKEQILDERADDKLDKKSSKEKTEQEKSTQPQNEGVFEQMKHQLAQIKNAVQTEKLKSEIKKKEPDTSEQTEPEREQAPGELKPIEDMTPQQLADKARGVLGEHETFASYANDRFNRYMLLAEQRMQTGEFYLSADAYSMAINFKESDPLAYAGKSHALFAAGEYMSSSLFLERTLNMFPEYLLFDINLVKMLGGKDIIETRISDIYEWIELSPGDVPELRMLLAYVYYQIDRIEPAEEQIKKAVESAPDNTAANTLYDTILKVQK